jgi:effector-binding domain-containing protein
VIEVGVQVPGPFEGDGRVVCSATPGGTAARALHVGPYDKLGDAHDAVRLWCRKNNHPIAGPNWEVYGDWNEDPNQLETEVFYLLK